MKDKKLIGKILVPVVIVMVIVGMWFIKNTPEKEEIEGNQSQADGTPFIPSDELQQEMEFIMYSDRESGEHVFTVHQGGLSEEQFRKILSEMGVE